MSYLVLARKSRPQTFDQVVGQKPVVKTLKNSLKRHRVAHAILFSGVRGVGKTTLARLMAKALNCQQGPTAAPCNECLSCTQIMNGTSLDLYEIDGASNRGIQEVRELKEKITFLPASSPYKIVIIDEVHMLTNEAFNALLKTLEEPPDHVYFMFATTELRKIPVTILSRCQRYELKRVRSDELTDHFGKLAAAEGIDIDAKALSLIVREAEGSVRDGLSLLDQVISYGESSITVNDVVEVLGLVNRDILNNITRALLTGDRTAALKNLDRTFTYGMDTKRFMADLLQAFRALLLLKIDGCQHLLDLADEDLAMMQKTAAEFTVESIHQKLSLLMKTAEDLRYATQPRLTLETAFLAIIESGNVTTVATLLNTLDKTLAGIDQSEEPPSTAPRTPRSITQVPPKTKETPAAPPPPETEPAAANDREPPWQEIPLPASERQPDTTGTPFKDKSPETKQGQRRENNDIAGRWQQFIAYVKERKPGTGDSLQQASGIEVNDQDILLTFDNPEEYVILNNNKTRTALETFLLEFFRKKFTLSFHADELPATEADQNPKIKRKKLASHPAVRLTEEILGGQAGAIRLYNK